MDDLEFVQFVEEVMGQLQRLPRRYVRDKENPMEFYSEVEFYRRYRFDKISVGIILEMLEENLSSSSRRGLPVPPLIQFLVTLRYFATGNFQLVSGDLRGLSQSTVCRIIRKVAELIARLRPKYVKFPSQAACREISTHFYGKARFPGVVGVIDGTHVPIVSPGGENAEVFRNRKRVFSLNCQGIVDHERKFIDFVTGWPGSTHDERMFNSSRTCALFERGAYKGILIGDSGYGCRPFLITPLRNPATPGEIVFNNSHKACRNIVERAFGAWKKKFACLSRKITLKLNTATSVIVATTVLHNIAADRGLLEEPDNIEEEEVDGFLPEGNNLGAIVRRNIIREYFD